MQAHNCPVCNNKISITKERISQGMDGSCYDWYFRCNNCNIVKCYLAADEFYERKCYKTKEEAISQWNNICNKYAKNDIHENI